MATTVSPASRPGLELQGQDGQDLVTVDDLAGGVHRQAAVGVTVVRDPGVSPVLGHRRRQGLQVRRTTVGVDVLAVRLGADRDHLGSGPPQQLGCQRRGSAVRTVHHHAQPGQRRGAMRPGRCHACGAQAPCAGLGGQQVSQVTLALAGRVTDPAKAAGGRPPGPAGEGHPRLDLVFRGVGQLEPAPGEQLDPVVGGRVVAGREHHPEVGPERCRQVGDAGRRDDAKAQHVHSGAGQARHHGGLKKLTGRPRIAAHHGHRAPALGPSRPASHAAFRRQRSRGPWPADWSGPRPQHPERRPCRKAGP